MGSAVLLIHDETPAWVSARDAIEAAGHDVTTAGDTLGVWRSDVTAPPDVIVMPWTGPDTAREILTRLRENDVTRCARVIVWAPQPDLRTAVLALELGADDCLALPFDPAELVARINACLRRPAAMVRPDRLSAGPLLLDKAVHCLKVRDQLVDLAPTEFRLMAFFLENQGRLFTRDELLRRAWSRNIKAGRRTVDVHVRRLRQVLEPFGCESLIQTVRGFGYRFAAPTRDGRAPTAAPLAARSDAP